MNNNPKSYEELLANPSSVSCSYVDNFINVLVELEAKVENTDTLVFYPLYTNLRFSLHDENLNNTDYSIGVKKATLYLETEGFNVEQSERFGEIDNLVREYEVLETASKACKNEAQSSLSVKPSSINTGTTSKFGNELAYSAQKSYSAKFSPVQPLTGNRWLICQETEEQSLIGLFIKGDSLCNLYESVGANITSISLTLCIKKTDIKFTKKGPSPKFKFGKAITDEKLLSIFTGKVLSKQAEAIGELFGNNSLVACRTRIGSI